MQKLHNSVSYRVELISKEARSQFDVRALTYATTSRMLDIGLTLQVCSRF